MFPVLLGVVIISLSGVMMPGPMFAVALAKSYRTPLAGLQMAAGHAVIEVPLILVIYLGFARFFASTAVQIALSLVGGGMIIWLGVSMFRSRREVVDRGKNLPYNGFVAGILMSGLNPFFLLWWATIGSMLLMQVAGFGVPGLAALTAVHWLCDAVWLSLVSLFVYRTQSFWNRRVQEGVFMACSLLLVGFGSWFIVSGVKLI